MIVSLGILLIHKVGIVGTDKFYPVFPSQFDKYLVSLLLQGIGLSVGSLSRVCHLMALQFQIIVIAP